MLSRTTHFLASIVALAGFSACSSTYSDVYSFKKNSFKAPPAPKTEIAVPPPTSDPFAGQPGTIPADPSMAIPGLSDPTAAPIPGLEAAPGTVPAPEVPPTPAPGTPEAAPGTTPPPAPIPSL